MINMQILNMLQQFKSDPMQMLNKKFKIPEGVNDPNAILKHLIDSGQVTQDQVNKIQNMQNLFK